MSEKKITITVQVSTKMHNQLVKLAKRENRSLSGQLRVSLEKTLDSQRD